MLYSRIPYQIIAAEFERVFMSDKAFSQEFSQWFYEKSLKNPEDFVSSYRGTKFTAQVIFTSILPGSVIDLLKVTTDKVDDTPAIFTAKIFGNTREFEPHNRRSIVQLEKVDVRDGVLAYKDKGGAYLYFDMDALNTLQTPIV